MRKKPAKGRSVTGRGLSRARPQPAKGRRTPTQPTRGTTGPAATPTPRIARSEPSFPIVGVGASAGGLEALEQFLRRMPEPCGMAFVIVVHLDPKQKGTMVELLQRATRMPVTQVKDRQKVERDRVYVIP